MTRAGKRVQAARERMNELLRQARLEVDVRDATLNMAIARLGGSVEGVPTARHNFLQRIDELVALEREVRAGDREGPGR